MKKLIYLLIFGIVITQLSSCGGDNDEPSTEDNTKDRQEVLINWADNIIIPAYDNFKVEFDVMEEKAAAFTASPDNTTLTEFRGAWIAAYTEWQNVELFEFGPAEGYGLRNFYNIYPTNVALMQTYIDDPGASLSTPASYPVQGFPALDYLLNGIAADDAAILEAYTTHEDAEKRRAYIGRLVVRMSNLLAQVVFDWNNGYRDTFISKTGLDIGSSMGKVTNAYVLEYERYVRSGKVGIPAGIFSSGTVQPDKVEAYYYEDLSKTLALAAHQAAHDFFLGTSVTSGAAGASYKSYLDALDAKDTATGTLLSAVIDDQFDIAKAKLNVLDDNFSNEVQSNNDAMTDAYADMQKIVRLLKVDMTSAMSITITYTDNDGD